MTYAVGQTVHGHRLVEKLGEGGFGDVWRADYLGQTVVLKVLHKRIPSAGAKMELFAQYALGRLPAPDGRFFPRVEHADLEADPAYVRMEYVEGRPLETVLSDPALALAQRLEIGGRILEALEVAHRHGYVHGDLSPANVLVTPDGQVKLIDIGFGRLLEEGADIVSSSTAAEQEKMGVASPLYAAPERFKSDFLEGCGKPADVFSFGKVLYRLVTGENPLVIKPVSLRFKALGAAWDDFVFKCLEERPEDRFVDAAAALAKYREIYLPQPAAGQYRAACAQCKRVTMIPGGWAGERFACRSCGAQLEVLFYDDERREATTDFVMAFVEEPAVFDAVVVERARKFCPSCGGSILVEALKCKHCHADVHEVARRYAPKPSRPPAPRSYCGAALLTFVAYFLFWIPGAILNAIYLSEAKAERLRTSRDPDGFWALRIMMWLFVWLPLGGVAFFILLGILAGLARAM